MLLCFLPRGLVSRRRGGGAGRGDWEHCWRSLLVPIWRLRRFSSGGAFAFKMRLAQIDSRSGTFGARCVGGRVVQQGWPPLWRMRLIRAGWSAPAPGFVASLRTHALGGPLSL